MLGRVTSILGAKPRTRIVLGLAGHVGCGKIWPRNSGYATSNAAFAASKFGDELRPEPVHGRSHGYRSTDTFAQYAESCRTFAGGVRVGGEGVRLYQPSTISSQLDARKLEDNDRPTQLVTDR